MIIPAVTQLPLFVLSTIFFSNLAVRPTPLESEAFLTLTSLARPDPTAALPIALGLTTYANVETAHWFVGEERAAKDAKRQEAKEALDKKKLEEGVPVLPTTKDLIQGGLRTFSVARIVFGVMVDGVSPSALLCSRHILTRFTVGHCVLVGICYLRTLPVVGFQLVGCSPSYQAQTS